jgi:hypothetical protein
LKVHYSQTLDTARVVQYAQNHIVPVKAGRFSTTSSGRQHRLLLFDNRIEILPVFHGSGLRFAAILLRRATMKITITTNRTPAMMRIVVGFIEALSLNVCGTGFAKASAAYYRTAY